MININGSLSKITVEAGELGNKIGEKVQIHGSVYRIRKMSGFAFVILRTKRNLVQCVYSDEYSNFPINQLREESNVLIVGEVISDERSKMGWELRILSLKVLSEPVEELPIVINHKKIEASMENLLDYRVITLRNERARAIFKIQEGLCYGIRQFLKAQKFTEIRTPKIVFAGAEGGANIFKLDYFGKDAFLAQSPQFYKQMMVGVYERVFEIAPVFRAEKHDTSRHLNEYTSIDFEMGFINGFEDIMHMETKMLKETLEYLQTEYQSELSLLGAVIPKIDEIPAIHFQEAKELISKEYHREIRDYDDFEPEEEKLLCETIFKKTGSEFVFVTHYPTKKRPFYAMENSENREETLSFDLLFRGLEVTTGGQRIHNYLEQVEKMEHRNMEIASFESYLMIHKYGIPPHGGLGLGLERFTSKLLLMNNVRFATLFPRDTSRVTP